VHVGGQGAGNQDVAAVKGDIAGSDAADVLGGAGFNFVAYRQKA
jgi:hypothetical protein